MVVNKSLLVSFPKILSVNIIFHAAKLLTNLLYQTIGCTKYSPEIIL